MSTRYTIDKGVAWLCVLLTFCAGFFVGMATAMLILL